MKTSTYIFNFTDMHKLELCKLQGALLRFRRVEHTKKHTIKGEIIYFHHEKSGQSSIQSKLDEALASCCPGVHVGGCGSASAE